MLKKTDKIITTTKSGRRSFIRTGSAFLLATTAAARAQESGFARSDCDGQGSAESKNPNAASSDSDTGESADRQGCGTKIVPITYRHEDSSNA